MTLSEKQLKPKELGMWLKWQITCIASMRLEVQTPVLQKKKKRTFTLLLFPKIQYYIALKKQCRTLCLTDYFEE
jgi:hypothetical protein